MAVIFSAGNALRDGLPAQLLADGDDGVGAEHGFAHQANGDGVVAVTQIGADGADNHRDA
jgi:hypothetical protein